MCTKMRPRRASRQKGFCYDRVAGRVQFLDLPNSWTLRPSLLQVHVVAEEQVPQDLFTLSTLGTSARATAATLVVGNTLQSAFNLSAEVACVCSCRIIDGIRGNVYCSS